MLRWFPRRRRVRLHFADNRPTLQGVLVGCYGGHYILEQASLLEARDRTVNLSGHAEVPRETVFFVQVNP